MKKKLLVLLMAMMAVVTITAEELAGV